MRPVLLHLDDALIGQSNLSARVAARGGQVLDCRDLGPSIRLWSRPGPLEALEDRINRGLSQDDVPVLTFLGSGDFHHVAAMLIRRACRVAAKTGGAAGGVGEGADVPVTIIHFDNHPDWVKFDRGLHCGSWVGQAARLPGVAKVITIGVCSSDIEPPGNKEADADLIDGLLDIYPYRSPQGDEYSLFDRRWPTIASLGGSAFAVLLDKQIKTEAIYITIDKDVLKPGDAATNWDQGEMGLDYLQTLIGVVATGRRVIGADIIGDWSQPRYGVGLVDSLLKRGEAMLDQPWKAPPEGARRLNETVNLSLFDCLTRVTA